MCLYHTRGSCFRSNTVCCPKLSLKVTVIWGVSLGRYSNITSVLIKKHTKDSKFLFPVWGPSKKMPPATRKQILARVCLHWAPTPDFKNLHA